MLSLSAVIAISPDRNFMPPPPKCKVMSGPRLRLLLWTPKYLLDKVAALMHSKPGNPIRRLTVMEK